MSVDSVDINAELVLAVGRPVSGIVENEEKSLAFAPFLSRLNDAKQIYRDAYVLAVSEHLLGGNHPYLRQVFLSIKSHLRGAEMLAAWAQHHSDTLLSEGDSLAAQDVIDLLIPVLALLAQQSTIDGLGLMLRLQTDCAGDEVDDPYSTDVGDFVSGADASVEIPSVLHIEALTGWMATALLPEETGRRIRRVFHPLSFDIVQDASRPELITFISPLTRCFAKLQQATVSLIQKGTGHPESRIERLACAYDYTRLLGLVLVGWMWLRSVRQSETVDEDKVCARYFFEKELPYADALARTLSVFGGNALCEASVGDLALID